MEWVCFGHGKDVCRRSWDDAWNKALHSLANSKVTTLSAVLVDAKLTIMSGRQAGQSIRLASASLAVRHNCAIETPHYILQYSLDHIRPHTIRE